MYSPLENFEIVVYKPLRILKEIDISITNSVCYNLIVLVTLYLICLIMDNRLIPSWIQLIISKLVGFLYNLVKNQTEGKGGDYFVLFYTLFLFILMGNLIGLIPFSFTVTSHFALTFGLSLSLNIGILWIGFVKNGLGFLRLFVPSGAPQYLLPLIVIIEIVSYIIRTFSLSIRLFANMMAGHTLLHILGTFTIRLNEIGGVFWIIPFILMMGVLVLELGIVFIQAYVFTILTCIYLNDSYHPSH
jgi:ATP synthase subunit 6